MGASPVSVPSGNPGSAASALAQVREAYKLLEQSLPTLPTGSEPHKAVLSTLNSLAKIVPASAEVPGVQQTQLRNLQQSAGQNAQLTQLMRSLGGDKAAGSSPAAPGAAPAAPAPAA